MSKKDLADTQILVGKAQAYFEHLELAMQHVGNIMQDIEELGFSSKDLELLAEESIGFIPDPILEWIREQ